MLDHLRLLLKITRSKGIARRYFIVNGFDGALTMLGIIMGFYVSDRVDYTVVVNTCLGAAIALGMSDLTSAYMSEEAEQKKKLSELEQAMLTDMRASAHGQAVRFLPLVIALVNSLSPLLLSLIIIAPVWLVKLQFSLPMDPLRASLGLAMITLFFLGVFLGRISGTHWLWSGLRTLLIAFMTAGVIYLFG